MPVQSEHVGTVTMRKTFAMDDGDDDPDDATSNNFLRVQAACILRVDMDKSWILLGYLIFVCFW